MKGKGKGAARGGQRPLLWRLRGGGGGGGGGSYRRKILVLIVLVCCSPVLVPLACLSLPLILPIFVYVRLERFEEKEEKADPITVKQEKKEKDSAAADDDDVGCFILHRYLEDQLRLVIAGDERLIDSR